MSDSDDMATMPIRDLIAALREKVSKIDNPLQAIVISVLANRLQEQADLVDQHAARTADALHREANLKTKLQQAERGEKRAKRELRDLEIKMRQEIRR